MTDWISHKYEAMLMGMQISRSAAHAKVMGPAHSTTVEEEVAELEEHHPDESVFLKSVLLGEWDSDD